MSRRYAILDSAGIGTSLSVEQAGEVLTIGSASAAKRSALVDIGVSGDRHFAEVMFWGEVDALTDNAAVGIAIDGDFSTASYPGADAYSIGYLPAEGAIYAGGVSVASVTAGAKGGVIGIALDLETEQVFFFLDGAQIHVADVSGYTGEWKLAVALGSDSDADLQAFVNTGQRAFQHPDALSEGWYDVPATPATEWVGTEDYTTLPADTPANQPVLGLIPDSQGITVTRSLLFPPEGSGAVARPTAASVSLINERDGDAYRFDSLIADVRDLPCTLYEGERDAAFSAFTTLGSFVIDGVEVVNDQTVRLLLKSNEATLDRPLQRKLFLPNVEGNAANRPVPFLTGAAYNIAPVLVDDVEFIYTISDDPLLGIGFVRDRGDKLDPAASTPDYVILGTFDGIELEAEPVGKLTLDASSIGGDLPVPPTNIAPANLAAWDSSSDVTEASGTYTFGDSYTLASGFPESWLKATSVMTVGRTYRYSLTISDKSGFFGGTGQISRLEIAHSESASVYPYKTFDTTGSYSGTFTAYGTDLVLRMAGTQASTDVIDLDGATLDLYEVDNAGVDSDNLLGATLYQALSAVFTRAGITESEWDVAGVQAIDTATGYTCGYYTQDQVTIREAIEAILPSWSACMSQRRDGVFAVYRLTAPEDRTADAEVGYAEILEPGLKVRPYDAPALATRWGCKRNETVLDPSDFVNDFDPVTGVPIGTRRELGRQFRKVVAIAGSRLAAGYAHAKGAFFGTRLISEADALTECERVAAIFDVQRFLYTFDVPMETAGQYDLDDVLELSYTDANGIDRYGLGAGKNVSIHAITEKPAEQRATLTCFG